MNQEKQSVLDDELENMAVSEKEINDIKDAETSEEEKELTFFLPEAAKITVEIKADPKLDTTDAKSLKYTPLSMLNVDPKFREELIERWQDLTFKGSQSEMQSWLKDVTDALSTTASIDPAHRKLINRDGAHWTQDPGKDSEYKALEICSPRVGSRKGIATGDRALSRVGAYCGLGRTVNVPLWNSGIWATMKAPSLTAELEFDRRIAADRVLLGRNTRGHIFSNDGAIINREFADFVLAHTIETSAGINSTDELLKIIKLPDLHALAIGLGSTIFVKGFPFRQPCVSNIEVCTHVEKATINIPKLLWVDNNKITEKQRRIMAKRGSKVSPELLQEYENEIDTSARSIVVLNENLSIRLKVPTLAEHFDVGDNWVTDLTSAADIAFGKSLSTDERNEYLFSQSTLTRMREHSHWVGAIIETVEADGLDEQIEHEPGVMMDRLLTVMSGDLDLVDKLVEGIQEFYASTVNTVVGIPNYRCPSCGKFHTSEKGEVKALHAIDPISVFFQMQQFRLTMLMTREN